MAVMLATMVCLLPDKCHMKFPFISARICGMEVSQSKTAFKDRIDESRSKVADARERISEIRRHL